MPGPIVVGSTQPTEVRLSPNGDLLYAADTDGNVRVYNTLTGALVATWDVGDDLGGMDVSPDGSFLVVVERQATTTGSQWDAVTPSKVYKIDTATGAATTYTFQATGYDRAFFDPAVLSDGTVLLSQTFAGSGWVNLKLLNLATGVFTTTNDQVRQSATFTRSPTGDKVFIEEGNGSSIFLYQTGVGVTATTSSGGFNYGVQAFNGSLAAFSNGEIRIADNNLYPSHALPGTFGTVADLAFGPDGKWLYVLEAENDQILKVDLSDGSIDGTFAVGSNVNFLNGVVGISTGSRLIVDPFERFFVVLNSTPVIVDNPYDLVGTPGPDTLTGGIAAEAIYAIGGNDTVNAGDGDDTIHGGAGADILNGEGGNDSIWTGRGLGETGFITLDDDGLEHDQVSGGDGDDFLSIGYGDDADGGNGNDTLSLSLAGLSGATFNTAGLLSQPYVLGGGTIQNIEVLAYLYGTAFNDTLTAATQATTLTIDGGAGDDLIVAGGSAVIANGGAGNDVFQSGAAADTFDGGAGFDTVVYSNLASGIALTTSPTGSWTGPGGDTLRSVERVVGTAFDDSLTAGGGTMSLFGGGGNDTLTAGSGKDELVGEEGDDTIVLLNPVTSGEMFAGDAGFDTLELRPFGPTSFYLFTNTTLSQLERINFASTANTALSAILNYSQAIAQAGGGQLTDVRGGDGLDSLILTTGLVSGGTFTVPALNLTNWTSSSNPLTTSGDLVQIGPTLAGDYTFIGRDNLGGTQALNGGTGNDTLVGSNGVDLLNGYGGANSLQGNGGNDVLLLTNYTNGGTTTTYDGAGSTFDGGSGFDTLEFAGPVNFQGAVSGIEQLYLAPANGTNLPDNTSVTISAATMASFGPSLTLAGTGTITVTLAPGDSFSAAGYVHAPGSAVSLVVDGSAAGGAGGNAAFYFGAAFTGADTVTGGAGTNDQIGLEGGYTGANALVLGAGTIANVEVIAVLPGFDYDITTVDANVPAGGTLKVFGGNLGAGDNLTFNGSAETDGKFMVYGGLGTDLITTGAGNDEIYFGPGKFNPAVDQVNGGAGANDQLALDGDYTLTLDGTAIQNVELIALLKGVTGDLADYNLTLANSLIGAGKTMTVGGSQLQTALTVNGSAETDGSITIYGGSGGDTLTGGAGNDWFWGGLGGDTLTGGVGTDRFSYTDAAESTGTAFDRLVGFDDSADTIDLPFAVAGFATPVSGALDAASMSAGLQGAFAGLGAHQAAVFTATSGDMSGRAFLLVDADRVTGYQAGADLLIELVSPASPIDQVAMFV